MGPCMLGLSRELQPDFMHTWERKWLHWHLGPIDRDHRCPRNSCFWI